jgi:hypothetical protein
MIIHNFIEKKEEEKLVLKCNVIHFYLLLESMNLSIIHSSIHLSIQPKEQVTCMYFNLSTTNKKN